MISVVRANYKCKYSKKEVDEAQAKYSELVRMHRSYLS